MPLGLDMARCRWHSGRAVYAGDLWPRYAGTKRIAGQWPSGSIPVNGAGQHVDDVDTRVGLEPGRKKRSST